MVVVIAAEVVAVVVNSLSYLGAQKLSLSDYYHLLPPPPTHYSFLYCSNFPNLTNPFPLNFPAILTTQHLLGL